MKRPLLPHSHVVRRVAAWLASAVDLIYPRHCALCARPVADPHNVGFCRACQRALGQWDVPTCLRCGGRVGPYSNTAQGCVRCRRHKLRLTRVYSLGPYEDQLREAVLGAKHPPGGAIAAALGRLLAERLARQDDRARWDLVVPVPHHWFAKLWTRYNHAAVLADHVAECLQIRLSERTLVQLRKVAPQVSLRASQRFKNVRDAFLARPGRRLSGAHVLLVDDVMTTGATANECAHELLAAGAANVSVAVVARTDAASGPSGPSPTVDDRNADP